MKVLKFGSATIANASKIKHIANLVCNEKNNIIVFSSIKGTSELLEEVSNYLYNKNTEGAIEVLNKLEKLYLELIETLFEKSETKNKAKQALCEMIDYIKLFSEELFSLFEQRALMAQGELISTTMLSLYFEEQNIACYTLPALDYMRIDRNMEPDMPYIKANLDKILDNAPKDHIYITQGYICRNAYGEIDDLHKGGSDFTAAIVGATVKAEEIQIWADMDVMKNNDPKYIQETKTIEYLSFDEAAELTYFGAKILHPTCMLPAKLAGVPVRLKNTQKKDSNGTLISTETITGTVKAIGVRDNITAINIKSGRMLLAHGFLRRIFEVFENYQTSIDMLASSEIGVSLTIDDCRNLKEISNDLKKYGSVSVDKDMVIVSIVGDSVIQNENIGSGIFEAIKNIPLRMISYGGSNLSFSFLIEKKEKERTLKILNEKLFN